MIFTNLEILIYSTLLFAPPLIIAAIGCNLTTSAGIINIGLDGFMTLGAFVGCAATFFLHNTFLGFIFAGIITAISSVIFAILVLKLKLNEILIGFLFNIFLPAAVVLISYCFFGSSDTEALTPGLKIPILFRRLSRSSIPFVRFISNIFSVHITTYLAFILVFVMTFILYKTKFGLYIRACNSNRLATNYVGINTKKLQYICIVISGFLYGISGAIVTMAITNQFKITSICGQGYIALAAVLFGESKPLNIMIYCLIFGFFSGLKTIVPSSSAYVHLVQTIPYIVMVLILIIKSFIKRGSTTK